MLRAWLDLWEVLESLIALLKSADAACLDHPRLPIGFEKDRPFYSSVMAPEWSQVFFVEEFSVHVPGQGLRILEYQLEVSAAVSNLVEFSGNDKSFINAEINRNVQICKSNLFSHKKRRDRRRSLSERDNRPKLFLTDPTLALIKANVGRKFC
ncbi:MAG: hypothetical protein ACLFS4_05230 [Opitutales bacterium]